MNSSPTWLHSQESVGCEAERHVVVKASSPSSFVVIEPELLFQLLIVALDAPSQFGGLDERFDGHVWRQGREPVFRRRAFTVGPFDQQPLLSMRLGTPIIAMRRPYA